MKRLSRWATAVAMFEGTLPLFDEDEVARIAAALVRLALDVTVRAAALATVMEAAGSPLASLAWSRAAEAALEVVVRTRGDIFVGDKWLPAKARRCGIPAAMLERARSAGSAEDFDRHVEVLGFPVAKPAGLVRLEQAEAQEFTFGRRTFQLVGGQMLAQLKLPSASLDEAIEVLGATAVAEAITYGAVSLAADAAAIDGRLS